MALWTDKVYEVADFSEKELLPPAAMLSFSHVISIINKNAHTILLCDWNALINHPH